MEKEFIIKTSSGALYQINYKKLFTKNATATLIQLKKAESDAGLNFYEIISFGHFDLSKLPIKLDLKDLKIGNQIFYHSDSSQGKTSAIKKIYTRSA